MELAPTRWNKRKHVNNDWMLLILVTVNPLDGLRSAVTKKVAQILTQSNFELLHPWKFTCHLKKDHCRKEISATGDIPQSLAAWVKSIPHLKEAKQYPVATNTTWWFNFSFEFVWEDTCLSYPTPFTKKTSKGPFLSIKLKKTWLDKGFKSQDFFTPKP